MRVLDSFLSFFGHRGSSPFFWDVPRRVLQKQLSSFVVSMSGRLSHKEILSEGPEKPGFPF